MIAAHSIAASHPNAVDVVSDAAELGVIGVPDIGGGGGGGIGGVGVEVVHRDLVVGAAEPPRVTGAAARERRTG